jgi:hypothetical protein
MRQFIVGILIVGTLSACSPTLETSADGHVALVNPNTSAVALAASSGGILTLINQKCFAVITESAVSVAVFPQGTAISADGESLTIPRIGTVTLGDSFVAGGGYVEPAKSPVAVPADCSTNDVDVLNSLP